MQVSIHAPVWGATKSLSLAGQVINRFNPRARVGRDHSVLRAEQLALTVSIHAPVWGATDEVTLYSVAGNVSIHAPVWGATLMAWSMSTGEDVSIHAPVWGATKNNQ